MVGRFFLATCAIAATLIMMYDEKRRHPRLTLKMLVQVRLDSLDEFLREYAANISMGGMFIRSVEPHPEGSMIYLQFTLADGEKLIEGLAQVIHVNPPDHPAPGMGVEFVNLEENSRALIEKILRERAAELEL